MPTKTQTTKHTIKSNVLDKCTLQRWLCILQICSLVIHTHKSKQFMQYWSWLQQFGALRPLETLKGVIIGQRAGFVGILLARVAYNLHIVI